ncbi:MAG: aminotransferase class V-fold PLP-dependent enzyme [Syntrophomonadaceae bacterium]|nr:aminotransferase class V-fold PLP-dependent enzyme [Syntrophomonadaceae bacterium]
MIYMDNAATSFPKPEAVYRAIDHFNRNLGGNPGRGASQKSLKAGCIVVEARDRLASLFNISDSSRIAFMANITEALNTALQGVLKPGDHVITTSMEHNSVARPLFALQHQGVEWTAVNCMPDGSLDPYEISRAIRPNTRAVCMLHASNVTGTLMPIKEVGEIAQRNQIIFIVDSAQTAGSVPIDIKENHIDILTFTGHKSLFGPQGTGGIYIRPGIRLNPLKFGGTGSISESLKQPDFMPDCLESGTLNTPGIAGLLAGVNYIMDTGLDKIESHAEKIGRMLIEGLLEIPGIILYGDIGAKKRMPLVSFNIKRYDCGQVSMSLEHDYGIITRSGLHCAPLAHKTLGTLETGTCRLSCGLFNNEKEVKLVLQALNNMTRSRKM